MAGFFGKSNYGATGNFVHEFVLNNFHWLRLYHLPRS